MSNSLIQRVSVIAAVATLAFSGTTLAQGDGEEFVEGQHYEVLVPAQPTSSDGKVEVAEIFSYSCIHCFNFEPHVKQWLERKDEDVSFVRIPAPWGRIGEIHAKAYYTAEALGVLEEVHEPMFRTFHNTRNYLETEDKLVEFFSNYGVEEDQFRSTFNSFSVNSKLRRAMDLVRRYEATETPMIVVNGKYKTKGGLAGNYQTWFQIIDTLTDREKGGGD